MPTNGKPNEPNEGLFINYLFYNKILADLFVDFNEYELFQEKKGGQNPGGTYKKGDTIYHFKETLFDETIREVVAVNIAKSLIQNRDELKESFPEVNFVRQNKDKIIGVLSKNIDNIIYENQNYIFNTYICPEDTPFIGLYDIEMILQFVNHGDLSNNNNRFTRTSNNKIYIVAIDFSKALKPFLGPLKYNSQPTMIDDLISGLDRIASTNIDAIMGIVDDIFVAIGNDPSIINGYEIQYRENLEDFKLEIKNNLLSQYKKIQSELLAWQLVKNYSAQDIPTDDINNIKNAIKQNLVSIEAMKALTFISSKQIFNADFINTIESKSALGTILTMAIETNNKDLCDAIRSSTNFSPEVLTYAAYMSHDEIHFPEEVKAYFGSKYAILTGLIEKAMFEKDNFKEPRHLNILLESDDNLYPEEYQNMLINSWKYALDNDLDSWITDPLLKYATISTLENFINIAIEKNKIAMLRRFFGFLRDEYNINNLSYQDRKSLFDRSCYFYLQDKPEVFSKELKGSIKENYSTYFFHLLDKIDDQDNKGTQNILIECWNFALKNNKDIYYFEELINKANANTLEKDFLPALEGIKLGINNGIALYADIRKIIDTRLQELSNDKGISKIREANTFEPTDIEKIPQYFDIVKAETNQIRRDVYKGINDSQHHSNLRGGVYQGPPTVGDYVGASLAFTLSFYLSSLVRRRMSNNHIKKS